MTLERSKLGNMALITTGLVVSRKQAMNDKDVVKNYKMLTLKSFEQDGWINTNELEIFKSYEDLDDKYLTQLGDVIVRLSNPYTAVTISESDEGIVIPSLFAIIRLEKEYILPEYLSIVMNSEVVRKIYTRSSVGSTIQTIKTSVLKDLQILVKPIAIQQKINEVYRLIVKERILLEQLLKQKDLYNKQIIQELLNEKVEGEMD